MGWHAHRLWGRLCPSSRQLAFWATKSCTDQELSSQLAASGRWAYWPWHSGHMHSAAHGDVDGGLAIIDLAATFASIRAHFR